MTKDIKFYPTKDTALLFPPEPIKKNLPDWFKNIPARVEGSEFTAEYLNKTKSATNGTIKRCVPFMDFMTSGYLLKFHSDILIDHQKRDGLNSFEYRHPGDSSVGIHGFGQLPTSINGKVYDYIKFINHWTVKTPPGYSCLFMQPLNFGKDNFRLFSGIVDTDTFDNPVNFPGYITATENFMINAGDPLIVVFPFKREEWKMSVSTEIKGKNKFLTISEQFFENVYRNFFHSKKRYD